MVSGFDGLMRQNGTETPTAHLSSTSPPGTVYFGRGLGGVPNTPNSLTRAVAWLEKKKRAATMGDPKSLFLLAPFLANVSNHVPGSRG